MASAHPMTCERCGKKYIRGSMQDMSRHCVHCEHAVDYCDNCVQHGCPLCGGELVDIWTFYKRVKGTSIIF